MLTDMECAILVEVLHVYLESINKKSYAPFLVYLFEWLLILFNLL